MIGVEPAAGDDVTRSFETKTLQSVHNPDTIADGARAWLKPGGLLLLEHGATQAPRLAAELVARGYAQVVCHPDLAGLPRVTVAQWPGRHSPTNL